MASILEYFNSKPKNTGASTFQTELASNKLINDAMLSDYPTLIGSVADNFETSFTGGIGNGKFPALLMHAADIFWGDATFHDTTANAKLGEIELLKSGRIRTSRDIIAILEYLLKNINAAPTVLPEFRLDKTTLPEFTSTTTTSTITASLSDGAIVGTDVKWTLTKNSGENLLAFSNNNSTTTGASATVKVIGTKPAAPTTAALGKITLAQQSSTTTEAGQNVVKATFTNGTATKNEVSGAYTLKAEYENSSNKSKSISNISCKLTSDNSPVKQSGTWGWNVTNKPASNFESNEANNTSNELTLKNTSTNAVTVTVTCTNKTGGIDNATAITQQITVQAITKPATKYYYLAGICGAGQTGFVGRTEVYDMTIYSTTTDLQNKTPIFNKTNVKQNLATICGDSYTTVINDVGKNWPQYFDYLTAMRFHMFVIVPTTWYNEHSSNLIVSPMTSNPVDGLMVDNFDYDDVNYTFVSTSSAASRGNIIIYNKK